jgi:DNA-binding CsgD family transcriptional regulator
MKMLSGREVQIIKHTARGFTAKEIAKMIGLEPRTVEIYVGNIRKKLVARNTAHAVFIATQQHILDGVN